MRFQFLKENRKKYNIKKACRILEISRSGYYDFLQRKKSKRAIENEALTEIIESIFHENCGRYGARRIQLVLQKQGVQVNGKRVSRLMSERGLVAKGTRKAYHRPRKGKVYEEKGNGIPSKKRKTRSGVTTAPSGKTKTIYRHHSFYQ